MAIEILKTAWCPDGERWTIYAMAALPLGPVAGADPNYFPADSTPVLLGNPPQGLEAMDQLEASFGLSDFFVRQSIVPVVLIERGSAKIRAIGTAFFISCTGYVMTAYHVVADPIERWPTRFKRRDSVVEFSDELQMGVVVPRNPFFARDKALFFPFEHAHFWGDWVESPLLHRPDEFRPLLDIAICKVSRMPRGMAHQPLQLSRFPFALNEQAITVGYAEMQDAEFTASDPIAPRVTFSPDIFVSVGTVNQLLRDNHLLKAAPTPGPCFDYDALIPGRMSGAPIFGADGAVVRGVVSRSYSGERHATGVMLDPVLNFPLGEVGTLKAMMQRGTDGIPQVQGPDRL